MIDVSFSFVQEDDRELFIRDIIVVLRTVSVEDVPHKEEHETNNSMDIMNPRPAKRRIADLKSQVKFCHHFLNYKTLEKM